MQLIFQKLALCSYGHRIVNSFEMVLTSIVVRENLTGEVRITGNNVALLAARVSSVIVYMLSYG